MPFRLHVPKTVYEEMIAHARAELPNECCGLLAGPPVDVRDDRSIAQAVRCYPLVNEAVSPTEYLSDPKSMFAAVRDMRERGLDILAVYHSHPTSAPVPSRKDRERNYSIEVINLIISLAGPEPEVAAWWLAADSHRAGEWQIVDDPAT